MARQKKTDEEAYIATTEFSRVLDKMPDSRNRARPGDLVAAVWFMNENWYIGIIEDHPDGLGFVIDDVSWGDLEGALHAVVLAKGATWKF